MPVMEPKLPGELNWYQNKSVLVMGLGVHGGALGNARWLHRAGAKLTITDLKSEEELALSKEALADLPDITWVLGEHRQEDFSSADLVLQNPAVPRDSEYLTIAREAGALVVMDASLFFQHNPATTVVGITGSKGKSTTAQAVAHVLAEVFPQAHTVGVEGTAPLATLDQIEPDDAVVFELSSWRLESLRAFEQSPRIAIVTSLYRDHLNTYDSWEDYVNAKRQIIRHQTADGVAILNFDDPAVAAWASEAPGSVWWYSRHEQPTGDGIWCEQGEIKVRLAERQETIASVSDLPVQGEHQQRNLLPGLLLAWHFGAGAHELQEKIASFISLPGRFELVDTIADVKFINDTTATIPEAAAAALKITHPTKTVLIAGGSDKNLTFDDLATTISNAQHIRHIILLPGTATSSMVEAFVKAGVEVPIEEVNDMPAAVSRATEVSQAGDIVLLSPGATSFGLFNHEFERGDAFARSVASLSLNK